MLNWTSISTIEFKLHQRKKMYLEPNRSTSLLQNVSFMFPYMRQIVHAPCTGVYIFQLVHIDFFYSCIRYNTPTLGHMQTSGLSFNYYTGGIFLIIHRRRKYKIPIHFIMGVNNTGKKSVRVIREHQVIMQKDVYSSRHPNRCAVFSSGKSADSISPVYLWLSNTFANLPCMPVGCLCIFIFPEHE